MKTLNTQTPMTTEPVAASSATVNPEFLRARQIKEVFGLKEGMLYLLWQDGLIESFLVRRKGRPTGVRLYSVESIRNYIRECKEEAPTI